jgi:hypothetical protein
MRGANILLPEYVFKAYVGEYLDLKAINKMLTQKAVVIGTVGEIFGEKKKKFVDDDVIDDVNWNSVILEREVRKAIEKAKMLGSEKVDVKKTRQKKQNADEIVHLALQGKSGEVLRRLVDASIRR